MPVGEVTSEMAKRMTCRHERAKPGPRCGLVHGSAATLVCDECQQWVMPEFDPRKEWRPLPIPDSNED